MKESLLLCILCFIVPSIAPMYCLTELLIFTVVLYTTFFCRQFLSRGHVSLSLQLHCLLGCVELWMDSIFLIQTALTSSHTNMETSFFSHSLSLSLSIYIYKILFNPVNPELFLREYLSIYLSSSIAKKVKYIKVYDVIKT